MDFDSNSDIIDSRDVTERINYLENEIAEYGLARAERHASDAEVDELEQGIEDCEKELASLRALELQGEGLSDWEYGATLVRDDYFEDYARQTAEDLGLIQEDAAWPACHIDWEAAADSLRMDYTSVEFDGVTYWAR